jgi:PleD family two-component response regulator
MGERIHVLAIDDNPDRVKQLVRYISEHDPDFKIEYPLDIKTLVRLIETTTFDCIISPEDISVLDNLELTQKLSEIMSLPIIRYLGESRLPNSTKGHS